MNEARERSRAVCRPTARTDLYARLPSVGIFGLQGGALNGIIPAQPAHVFTDSPKIGAFSALRHLEGKEQLLPFGNLTIKYPMPRFRVTTPDMPT